MMSRVDVYLLYPVFQGSQNNLPHQCLLCICQKPVVREWKEKCCLFDYSGQQTQYSVPTEENYLKSLNIQWPILTDGTYSEGNLLVRNVETMQDFPTDPLPSILILILLYWLSLVMSEICQSKCIETYSHMICWYSQINSSITVNANC